MDASDPAGAAGLYLRAAGGVWVSEGHLALGRDVAPGAIEISKKGHPWASGKETPLAVRTNDRGLYEIVTRSGIGAQAEYIQHALGPTGALDGKPLTIQTSELGEKEKDYNQDLNGNGQIGR